MRVAGKEVMPQAEREAIETMKQALDKIELADMHAGWANYGSAIAGSIEEARKAMKYAIDTAEGRT